MLMGKIAGLTLIDRLFHVARKSGIQKIIVLCARPHLLKSTSDSVKFVSEIETLEEISPMSAIVLKCGYLPDVPFFKSLMKAINGGSSFVMEHHRSLFIIDGPNESQRLKMLWEKEGFESFYDELEHRSKCVTVETGHVYETRNPEQISMVEDQLFKKLIKETEGFMSKHFERKISLAISKRLVETSITPNQMTVISVSIGLLGALLMGINRGFWQISGSILFLAHSILDGCDGEIARIKFSESRLGGILDFWGDNVVHSFVFMAIAYEWWNRTLALLPLSLAALAVIGALSSAGLIYWRNMRSKSEEGPLFTSVTLSNENNKVRKFADFLTRRDFIYLVIILSFFKHLDLFLVFSAIGAPAFFLVILSLSAREGRRFDQKHG